MPNIGPQEVVLIALLVLLIFGARKIPEYMRGLGEGIRELRRGIKSVSEDEEAEPHA